MSSLSESFRRVHYEFRPAKQVERKMLLETFQKLMEAGFSIADYQYTGMGSIYFIDFILLHRYIGISRFLSVEKSDIPKRVKFNRPFKLVRTEIGDIADYVPHLSSDLQHVLWLDFDSVLRESILSTVLLSCSQLSPGSILLVTVDVEPPGPPEDGPEDWMNHFLEEAGDYLWPEPNPADFSKSSLPEINARILDKAIRSGLEGRENVGFCPLFKFVYADGHKMLSLGGMIARADDKRKLRKLHKAELPFLRNDLSSHPYEIRVPCITRKERLYLDAAMPCRQGWKPKDFELDEEEVKQYKTIYRYYPAYTEMLF